MSIKFTPLLTLFTSIALIAACSSSTSSSGGSGQIPTGQYTGNLNGQIRASNTQGGAVSTRIILNVVTAVENGAITNISGNMVVTGGDRCWTGGNITGGGGGGGAGGGGGGGAGDGGADGDDDMAGSLDLEELFGNTISIIIPEALAQSSINGNQLILDISTNEGSTLTMTGRVTDNSYSGTFNSPDSRCGAVSGGFDLRRV